MDREKAKKILKVFQTKPMKTKTGIKIHFARQSIQDVKQIEKSKDDELIAEWKSLTFLNYIYGQVSLNELERISLIELEIGNRKDINTDKLNKWFKKQEDEFDIEKFI